MPKEKRCGQVAQIENRVQTSTIKCHKMNCHVTIEVTSDGNKCMKEDCPYNPGYLEKKQC
jgi:hypothetical protein